MSSKKNNNRKDSLENLMNTFGKTEDDNRAVELDLGNLKVSENEYDGVQQIDTQSIDVADTDDSLTIEEILENMTANSEMDDDGVSQIALPEMTENGDNVKDEPSLNIVSDNNTENKEKGNKNKGKNKNKSKNKNSIPTVASAPSTATGSASEEIVVPAAEAVSVMASDKKTPEEKKEKKKNKDRSEKVDQAKKKNKDADDAKPSIKKDKKTDKKVDKKEDVKSKEASEETSKDSLKNASPMKLIVTLTVICAAVALLLAAVNHFTEPKIEENNKKAILASIRNIFDESVQAEEMTPPEGSGFTSLYLVMKDEGICGYSAAVSPSGFGGPINLMVGMDSAGTVVGVDVVSMSETTGLGSKTGGAEFLSQFVGATGDVKVDAISGASISSNAVADGVRSVTNNLIDLDSIAEKRGVSVVPYVRTNPAETTTVTTAPVTDIGTAVVPETTGTTVPVTTEQVIGAPDVSKNDAPPEIIVQNPDHVNPDVYAEYTEVTTEFETLTTEPESSDLETGETSSAAE